MKSVLKIATIIIIGVILGLIIIEWRASNTRYTGDPCGVETYVYPPTPMELEVVETINQKCAVRPI